VNLQYQLDEKQLKVVGHNQVSFQSNIGSDVSLPKNHFIAEELFSTLIVWPSEGVGLYVGRLIREHIR